VADYLKMLKATISKVSIGILVAVILKMLRCGVYFMLCTLLVISTLILLFLKQILLLLQLLSLIVLPPSLISNLSHKGFLIYYNFSIGLPQLNIALERRTHVHTCLQKKVLMLYFLPRFSYS
jgi:hypothetical protein